MSTRTAIRAFRGLATDPAAHLLEEGQLSDMRNMRSDGGVLVKRPGISVASGGERFETAEIGHVPLVLFNDETVGVSGGSAGNRCITAVPAEYAELTDGESHS